MSVIIGPSPGFKNPMTTGGDVIYGGSSGVATRLGNGSSGQFLKSNGTTLAPSWASVTASAAFNFTSQSSTYSASINDYVFASGASFAITLPTAVGVSGQQIAIQHAGTSLSQVYTLNTTSGQTITGAGGTVASGVYMLWTTGETTVLVSDNANWQVLESKTTSGPISLGAIPFTATSAYAFTNTAANATIGAVYSNSGFLFTVTATITGGTNLTCAGTGTPATLGTLTKVSGTGDATITYASRTITGAPIAGVTSPNSSILYRSGVTAQIVYRFAQSGASGAQNGTGDYCVILQPALTLDTTNTPVYTGAVGAVGSQSSIIGNGAAWDSGPVHEIWWPIAYSANLFRLRRDVLYTSVSFWSAGAGGFNSANNTFTVTVNYPVLGWQP